MTFQKTNVEIYDWILEYLTQNNNQESFRKLRAMVKRNHGIANEKVMEAFNTLVDTGEIEEKKMGEEIFIIKL